MDWMNDVCIVYNEKLEMLDHRENLVVINTRQRVV